MKLYRVIAKQVDEIGGIHYSEWTLFNTPEAALEQFNGQNAVYNKLNEIEQKQAAEQNRKPKLRIPYEFVGISFIEVTDPPAAQ